MSDSPVTIEALGGNAEHNTGEVFTGTGAAAVVPEPPELPQPKPQPRMWIVEVGGARYWVVGEGEDSALGLVAEQEEFDELDMGNAEARLATFQEACGQYTNPEDMPDGEPTFLGDFLEEQTPRILGCSEWP